MLARRSRYRLPFLLAAIFATFHLIVLGGAMLESPQGGEGFAFVVLVYDWPLLALSRLCAICGHQYHGWGFEKLFILWAGTVTYAVAGFLIGTTINGVRSLIARD